MKTNIWTACQFNFDWLNDNPTRSLADVDKSVLFDGFDFAGCGIVNTNYIGGSRILITSTLPEKQQESFRKGVEEYLYERLRELGIIKEIYN